MQNPIQQQSSYGRLEIAVRSILSPSKGGRSQNEDNYLLIDINGNARFMKDQHEIQQSVANWPTGHVRVAILDGMGGHSYGREATERTVEGILQIAATSNIGALSDHLDTLHRRLHHDMHREGAEPGCTLTLLEIPPSGPALLFHAGDSRLYEVNEVKAAYLTIDHIPATKMALYKLIEHDEWYQQTHEHSTPQISQAFVLGNGLGTPDLFSEQLIIDLFELHDGNLPSYLRGLGDRRRLDLHPDTVYVLASDGLWHLPQPQAFIQRWPELLLQPDQPLQVLLDQLIDELIVKTQQEPRLRGDNSTAIALRFR